MCTRLWTTSTVIMAILVQCDVIYPLRLFYTYKSAFQKQQVSRHQPCLITLPLANNESVVLAPNINIYLFRTAIHRFDIPSLLHSPLRQNPRIAIPFARPLRLPTPFHLSLPPGPLPPLHPALPRPPTIQHPRVHLVSAEPRCALLPPRPHSLASSIPALYSYGP